MKTKPKAVINKNPKYWAIYEPRHNGIVSMIGSFTCIFTERKIAKKFVEISLVKNLEVRRVSIRVID